MTEERITAASAASAEQTEEQGPGTPASELLPHRFGMLLLDELVEADETGLTARAAVRGEDGLFTADGRMGSWVLLEYMAQGMAMWISWNARREGKPVPVGFLLGTRKMELLRPDLPAGTVVTVRAEPLYVSREDRLAQFDCRVLVGDETVATAKLNAFEPEDPATLLETLKAGGKPS